MNLDLDLFAAAGDDREHGAAGCREPHVVLQLSHVLVGRSLFHEGPGEHELGLEHRVGLFDNTVERRSHPFVHGVAYAFLDVRDSLPGGSLVPRAVQDLGHSSELNDQIVGKIFWLNLAALLSPKAKEESWSSPKTMRASEPPMKWRLSFGLNLRM